MASNTANTGGYDYKWIEDPSDELKCLICLSVARDPQQHGNGGCGKVFCQSCISLSIRNITTLVQTAGNGCLLSQMLRVSTYSASSVNYPNLNYQNTICMVFNDIQSYFGVC